MPTHMFHALHHMANSGDSGHAAVDKEFFHRVVAEVSSAGAILIVGPGSAKIELRTYIAQHHPQVAAKISAVETLDHPTDGELLAFGRRFFSADDRMHLQVPARTG
jgi:stalled ribosome rescue protein Dom34